MTIEETLVVLYTHLKQKRLSDLQELVFYSAWQGQTYEEIASNTGYDADYIRHIGSYVWQLLSEAFQERVTKKNFRSVLRQPRSRENK
ncbi:hypothetical protein [Synechocystis sp. PCC 7509]|uniref:hypothetical protein n=1 Tax=Synechocystis sp. PCC 7509 TaxID=927677 RepID=UPI0002AC6426|nr:hypothetical protein [Synechocystis sp. PCC 7509]